MRSRGPSRLLHPGPPAPGGGGPPGPGPQGGGGPPGPGPGGGGGEPTADPPTNYHVHPAAAFTIPEGWTETPTGQGERRIPLRRGDDAGILCAVVPIRAKVGGSYEDIDTSIRPDEAAALETERAGYGLRVPEEDVAAEYFGKRGGSVLIEGLAIGEVPVGALEAADRQAAVEPPGNVAAWTFPTGHELRIEARPDMLKLTATVPSAEVAQDFTLRASISDGFQGVAAWDRIVARDAAGRDAEVTLSATDPVDDDGVTIQEVRYTVTGRTRALDETGQPTEDWQEGQATYPIVVDPQITEDIIDGADDAGVLGGNFTATGESAIVGNLGIIGNAGFRFQSVSLPAGAVVNNATLTVELATLTGASVDVIVRGDLTIDAPAWKSGDTPEDIDPTTAGAAKTFTATGLQSVDITAIVQELANRAGHASGQALRFSMFDNGSDSNNYTDVAMFESPTAAAAQLFIDYSDPPEPGSGGDMLLLCVE